MKRDHEKEKALQVTYEKYRRGDHITDQEIRDLLKAIALAIPFLQASPDFALMRRQASLDEWALYDFQQARKRNREEERARKRRK